MATDKKGSGVGALYLADLGYPMLPKGATEDAKFDELQDYLYRLVESLRWTLEHLDESNFNQNFFLDIAVGEMYKPLPVIWTVDTYQMRHYYREAELATIEDHGLRTELWLGNVGTDKRTHYPQAPSVEIADGSLADALGLEFEWNKESHSGPL